MLDAMSDEIVKAMYETLPVEITVIDADDHVVGWNRHDDRLFYRPETSMGANFRECHPAESLDKVERIVAEMKGGQRDKAEFWIDLAVDKATGERHKVSIEFYALRDPRGRYLGCMECTTDVERYRRLAGERRLLDET